MAGFEMHPSPPLPAVIALLRSVELPASDLTESHLKDFFSCGPVEALSGLIGLEILGSDALLRSLAVAAAARGTGMGSALVQQAEQHALANGVSTVYLLTTSARRFFEKQGYRLFPREDCPEGIRSTAEFASLCPASSALLMKRLRAN